MDTRMPIMNGFEAIQRIRASAGGALVKIVSVTASAFDEDRKKAIEIGADDFLGKPFREEVLLEKIKELLKVDYVYADEPAASDPEKDAATEGLQEKVAAVPEELLSLLHEATLSADLDQMLDLIQRIEQTDAVVAKGLKCLAEGFEYQALLSLTTRRKE
jgi:DNA-binding response OmpR family regulator